jgi:hypothetical protein
MFFEGFLQQLRQHRHSILSAFAIAHKNFVASEVNILAAAGTPSNANLRHT